MIALIGHGSGMPASLRWPIAANGPARPGFLLQLLILVSAPAAMRAARRAAPPRVLRTAR